MASNPIKDMEKKRRSMPVEPIDFDTWWMLRKDRFNVPDHLKEVVRADFKGRKLFKTQPPSVWDEAARKFGLNVD